MELDVLEQPRFQNRLGDHLRQNQSKHSVGWGGGVGLWAKERLRKRGSEGGSHGTHAHTRTLPPLSLHTHTHTHPIALARTLLTKTRLIAHVHVRKHTRTPTPASPTRPIRVGKNDARGATATLLTLRLVRNDNVLAGDGLAEGLASMFRLRNGLRGSQSRMA
jgi:hypothetical protein